MNGLNTELYVHICSTASHHTESKVLEKVVAQQLSALLRVSAMKEDVLFCCCWTGPLPHIYLNHHFLPRLFPTVSHRVQFWALYCSCYICSLFQDESSHYADDIQLYFSLTCFSAAQTVNSWMSDSFLHLNEEETLSEPHRSVSKLRETLGPPASSDKPSIRNLGLTFLSAFTLDARVKSLLLLFLSLQKYFPVQSH